MPVRLQSATARLARLNPSLEAFSPNFDGTVDSPASFTGILSANLQGDAASFSGNYQSVSDIVGTIGATLDNFTSNITSVGGSSEPYDLSGFSIPFTVTWPTAPTTTRQVTVTSASQFNAEAAVDGTQITVGQSFSGNITISGDDIDVVMDNADTITGTFTMDYSTPPQRIRWTGGNLVDPSSTSAQNWRAVSDVLFSDVHITGRIDLHRIAAPTTACNRVAFVNCTTDARGYAGFVDLTLMAQPTGSASVFHEDIILANHRSENSYNSPHRFHQTRRVVIVESAFNAANTCTNAFRFHEGNEDVFVAGSASKPVIAVGTLFMTDDSSYGYGVRDSVWDYVHRYRDWNRWARHASGNTGTVTNTRLLTTDAGETGDAIASISPMTAGAGVGTVEFWDGVLPDASSYGAQR